MLELSKSDNEFPINLDEVWMLVYPRKDHAVRALEENFIKDVDYVVFPKNGENPNGGRPTNEYRLSVPCMEYFIARKVRPVFEVYRQVFHKAVQSFQVPQTFSQASISDKMKAASWAAKFLNLNENSKLILAKQILDPLGLPLPDYTPSKGILKSATELLKENGSSLSIREFTALMIQHGYLADMTRKAAHGQTKYFKTLTAKAKQFGENQVSPKAPNQTQPMYYADNFGSLINVLKEEV